MYCSSMFMRPFRERERDERRRKYGSIRGKERNKRREKEERKGQAMEVVGVGGAKMFVKL
jgi:hypothetical protein